MTPVSTVLILEDSALKKMLILVGLQLCPVLEKARVRTLVGATVTISSSPYCSGVICLMQAIKLASYEHIHKKS